MENSESGSDRTAAVDKRPCRAPGPCRGASALRRDLAVTGVPSRRWKEPGPGPVTEGLAQWLSRAESEAVTGHRAPAVTWTPSPSLSPRPRTAGTGPGTISLGRRCGSELATRSG